jgi:Zn-dependent protease/predicted transcriptional regulator
MRWKIKIGRFADIDVYLHMTFFLLLVWVAASHWMQGVGIGGVAAGLVFVLAIFACVTLHEFGHALAARRFGVRTRDIILLPIGGVARLERMPRKPAQEILVALAGPAVNLVLAGLLFFWLHVTAGWAPLSTLTVVSGPLLERLMVVNLFLLVFNLIPAFPMDGGRVLRALLALRGDYVRATRQAAQVGKGFAFLFGLWGLLIGHPMLVFVAFFVWIGAAAESGTAHLDTAMSGIPVERAMLTDFRGLTPGDRLEKAVSMTLAGSQNDFPVVHQGRVVGVLTQSDLMAALRAHGDQHPVGAAMQQVFVTVEADEMLEAAFRKLSDCRCHTLPVLNGQQLVGLLTMENVGEFVRIQSALEGDGSRRTPANGRSLAV